MHFVQRVLFLVRDIYIVAFVYFVSMRIVKYLKEKTVKNWTMFELEAKL